FDGQLLRAPSRRRSLTSRLSTIVVREFRHSRPQWSVLSRSPAPGRGTLKVHQRIGSRYAGECTRGTVMAHRHGLRRAADRLLPVAGRRRPRGTDPAAPGREGGRLPHATGPPDPTPAQVPPPF